VENDLELNVNFESIIGSSNFIAQRCMKLSS